MKINTTAEFMNALAIAIETKDLDAIERIDHAVSGWMDEERPARSRILCAISELIYETE